MNSDKKVLGINGLGRIGKLTVWQSVFRKYFDEIVVNLGRQVGTCLGDIAHYLERDSTYGHLSAFLHGYHANPVISDLDEATGRMTIDGTSIRFLRAQRNPSSIGWADHQVRLVVDTTGQFLDPSMPPEHPKGSARGHLMAGAEKVVVSAPFKLSGSVKDMPGDTVTTVMGINGNDYDPRIHSLISNASCTTTCLAHMIKPLLNHFGSEALLSASMSTIHAATGSQEVLDKLPKAGKTDLRKNRSVMNNIILTSTGAATALGLVIPEMRRIGFIAESVRIPTTTGSLIILVLNFQEDPNREEIRRQLINDIYARTASNDPSGYLNFSDKQNVSSDIIGMPRAAVVIESKETHTRTATATINLNHVPGIPKSVIISLPDAYIRVPVTQAVIYGWYDNEMGSYVNMLCDRIESVADLL
ncbi:MAG: glyceraldehyde-3-phosphate dehydrogenase [Proteobacteria bacterium]|nr:glyceraldehyde-3-phosphate dehydrogenase [Pseudomonadota bacterium]